MDLSMEKINGKNTSGTKAAEEGKIILPSIDIYIVPIFQRVYFKKSLLLDMHSEHILRKIMLLNEKLV